MPQPRDYIVIPVTDEMVAIAQWFARRRILYEYPEHDRRVFGDYGEGQVGVIAQGIIAELAVFDYLHGGLLEVFGPPRSESAQPSCSGSFVHKHRRWSLRPWPRRPGGEP